LVRTPATLIFYPASETGSAVPAAITIVYQPKVALTLAGRGAIFRATAKVANAIGIDVTGFSPDMDDLLAVTAYCKVPPTHVTSRNSITNLNLDQTRGFITLFRDHDWEGISAPGASCPPPSCLSLERHIQAHSSLCSNSGNLPNVSCRSSIEW
jgi:xanthine dehydrogenase accessory factor